MADDSFESVETTPTAKKEGTAKAKPKKKSPTRGKVARPSAGRVRTTRPYPSAPFDDVIVLAQAAFKTGSGLPVRRLTLFDELGRSPESSTGRDLVTNSGKYGLTRGGYTAEQIELTDVGKKAVDPDVPPREQARARIDAAIFSVEVFAKLFELFVGKKLPSRNFLLDAAREAGIPADHLEEAIDTFVLNLRSVGLLKALAGAERVVSVDMALDVLPATHASEIQQPTFRPAAAKTGAVSGPAASFEQTCFMITPIGDPGSPQRVHSDLIIGSFVEPALDEFKLTVVRADKIDKPGLITQQVIDYIMNAKLVIADLSFSNPNVFYELALRHSIRRPIVQIVRDGDPIPFDVNQMRTIQIDLSDVYSAIPKLELMRTDIRNQVRRALENPDEVHTPISLFYPNLKVSLS